MNNGVKIIGIFTIKQDHPVGVVLFYGGDEGNRFAFSPIGRKLMFGSVKPSPAVLIRTASGLVRFPHY